MFLVVIYLQNLIKFSRFKFRCWSLKLKRFFSVYYVITSMSMNPNLHKKIDFFDKKKSNLIEGLIILI